MVKFPENTKKLSRIFNENGYEIYAVGGSVRDALLGKLPDDIDFCTNATPKQMLKMFPHSIKTGIKHGTLTIPFMKGYYEVTTYRIDGKYTDGRHPDNVNYSNSLKEDLSRRDFTINAMACSVETGEIIDLFGGKLDLDNHIIRTVGNPYERFSEDALRMLRAIRFESKLGFLIEKNTYTAIKELKDNIKNVSKERIRTEFLKILEAPFYSKGLDTLVETGLIKYVLPYINVPFENSANHYFDIDIPPQTSPILSLTAILSILTDDIQIVRKTVRDLKLSNKECDTVLHIFDVIKSKNNIENCSSDYEKRLFLSYLKREYFDDYFTVLYIKKNECYKLKTEFQALLSTPLSIDELSVNGNDMMKLGLKGCDIGEALSFCLDEVLKEPGNNTRPLLLNKTKTLYHSTKK